MSLLPHLLAAALLLATATPVAAVVSMGDTTLPADIAYSGYRLHVRDVELVKEKRGRYLLRVDVVNTGRRPVAMGPGLPVRFLQTVFDESLAAGGLVKLGLPLRGALVASRERFEVGEWKEDLEFWLDPADQETAPELTTDDFERRRVKPRAVASAEEDRAEEAENLVASAASPADTPGLIPLGDEACPDLAVASMRIVIRDANSATIQFSIANIGEGSVRGESVPDGLPLDIFLGGAAKISGSSKLVAQVDLAARLKKRPDQQLAAGEAMTIIEQVDTRTATRYTGVLTARLDGGQALRECEETNNEASVLLEE